VSVSSSVPRDPRIERLLTAPIAGTVLRLASPGIVLVAFQSALSITDAFFVGRLGTAPLAGLSLVFPLIMLLQMMSAGAMGGGVASAIARALGAGNEKAARSLTVHAVIIGIALGLLFTLCLLAAGPSIYRLLGGKEDVLGQALGYSNVVFAGAVLVWLANTLASILRGSGNMLAPAVALAAATVLHIPLSGLLVLGGGPLPALGIAGAGVAYLSGFTLASLIMLAYLLMPGSRIRPTREELRLDPRMFWEILRVGAVSSVNSMLTVLTAVLLTGIVGTFGTAALAGYGVGVRLELMQVPLVFAIGQALVAHIGTNIGAGQIDRAKRIAWTGASIAACFGLAIGLYVALFPLAWASLFSNDPAVLEACSQYLRRVAPFYPFLSIGVALYFASQGAGRMGMPLLAGVLRLLIATIGGFAAVRAGAPVTLVFYAIAIAMFVYGSFTGWAVARSDWSLLSKPASKSASR
jgi:putative MATE family efflux protein